jgi:protein SCO1/2
VNRTGSVCVFGPGDVSVIYTGGTTPRQYAEDFRRLLAASD